MDNGLIAFIFVLFLGLVLYVKIWWDGEGMSFKYTKWFFGITFAVALIVGLCTWIFRWDVS